MGKLKPIEFKNAKFLEDRTEYLTAENGQVARKEFKKGETYALDTNLYDHLLKGDLVEGTKGDKAKYNPVVEAAKEGAKLSKPTAYIPEIKRATPKGLENKSV